MLLIAVLALSLAIYLSRRLVSPLSELTQVTTNLPNRLFEGEAIDWPSSPVKEIGSLVRNFQLMALTLNQKFHEIKRANETLEERVQNRTQELLKSNEELEIEIKRQK